ncbi:U3 small nucleolar RNA-associated protein 15 homolog [Cylas formicarius]|uniref:U3 small nucleolar RNA-associated protein 15 homolog n=1 Tax=Cylas formicarius TaxID=197179 RepID=UPI002958808C|nr:U3 small nucleolar RNA-associated protein 15 homolog [Cylas formicarius]
MSTFKRLNTNIYEKSGPEVTPDFIYWKKLAPPILIKEFGPIDYVDFSPVEPHCFAVTCSVRVQVYNPITKLVVKNLSRFRENAYGAIFRSDGTLICAGGEESNVKLFDVSTKSMLRFFKGHLAPVHRTAFMPQKPQIASFSDDKTVRVWDVATEATLHTYSGHDDYVRAGVVSNDVPDIVLSGSYDNCVKMYDTRTDKEVMSVNHGSPVESLLVLPSGGLFLSAGGTDIKIWDTIAGGKLVGSISQHHKTITCLKLASDNRRLLSGSLDRHVKIYDISSFKVVHTLDFPNGVLSVGVSKNDDTLVAGLVDGIISVQRREEDVEQKKPSKAASYQYISSEIPYTVDTIIPDVKHDKEAKYDHHLRKFEYSKALNAVLMPYVINKHPERTVALLQELMKRKALGKAILAGNMNTIKQLVRFFIRNITDLRFSKIIIQVADEALDTITENLISLPPDIGALLVHLHQVLKQEEELSRELAMVQGMMQTLLASQLAGNSEPAYDKIIPLTDT